MNTINIFCHRGLYGCTDVNQDFLRKPYAKGEALSQLPPENSYESLKAAFDAGYGIETDVCMTRDHVLVITHTNHLSVHAKEAKLSDYVSRVTYQELSRMRTGMGERTAPFLRYDEFLNLFAQYPNLMANVEIKGTIAPKNALDPQINPSIVERLTEETPQNLKQKIIWSSFSKAMIGEFKKLDPTAKVAQLFCEKKQEEPQIFSGRSERYMQFTLENLKRIHQKINLEAVHPEIQTIEDNETLAYCRENDIHIRTWALLERHPEKDRTAEEAIRNIVKLGRKYPDLKVDIITDYGPAVQKILKIAICQ